MIKNKTFTRKCALRLLDHILQRDSVNCRRFVNLPGLGTLFSAFMKAPKKKRPGFDEKADEEHLTSIIANLFQNLENIEQGKIWVRVLNKFREEDLEKVEKLLELYEKYLSKVKKAKAHIAEEIQKIIDEGDEIDSVEEENFLLEKLDAGFATLQHIIYIMAVICQANAEIKEKVSQLLTLQGSSFEEVKKLLLEYAQDYGGALGSAEEIEKERASLIELANDLVDFEGPVYQ